MKRVTRVICPNCEAKFEIDLKYDEHFDSSTICPRCAWQTSLWGFNLDQELLELDIEDYKRPTDEFLKV